jgi:hypothetical protein
MASSAAGAFPHGFIPCPASRQGESGAAIAPDATALGGRRLAGLRRVSKGLAPERAAFAQAGEVAPPA